MWRPSPRQGHRPDGVTLSVRRGVALESMTSPRYGCGMTTQMTIRLADEAAEFVDRTVAEGRFTSRADYLSWLVRRDAMRRRAIADVEKLRAITGDGDPYPELSGLAEYAADLPLDID